MAASTGDAGRLRPIEEALAAADPALAESLRSFREPAGRSGPGSAGTEHVPGRIGAVLLVGLLLLAVGPVVGIVVGVLTLLVVCCRTLGADVSRPRVRRPPRFGSGHWSA